MYVLSAGFGENPLMEALVPVMVRKTPVSIQTDVK